MTEPTAATTSATSGPESGVDPVTIESILACPNLPTLPMVAMKVLELTRDPDVNLGDIERLVLSDQGLASRVLRTVNSSLYSLQKEMTTIKRALAYLGLDAVKSLVLGFSLVDVSRALDEYTEFDFNDYWRRVVYGATGARHMAEVTGVCDPDEAFTCGIFQDMGMLAMLTVTPNCYMSLLQSTGDNHDRMRLREIEGFGFDHAMVGALLGERWKMPHRVVESIRYHHDTDDAPEDVRALARIVALGRFAADSSYSEDPANAMAHLLVNANNWFGHDVQDFESMLTQVGSAAQELASVLDQDLGDIPEVTELMSRASDQQLQQQVAIQRDMEAMREQKTELERMINTDTLTGIANRKRFDTELRQGFQASRECSEALSVLFSDADRFKLVNDNHGHQAGDAVLIALAQRLSEAVGSDGIVCRYGGEEFAVILPGCDSAAACEIAERARMAVEAAPFDLRLVDCKPDELAVTISIGVATLEADGGVRCEKPEQLTREADDGVYEAKRTGRNCVRHFINITEPIPAKEPPVASTAPPVAAEIAAAESHKLIVVMQDSLASFCLERLLADSGAITSFPLRTSREVLVKLRMATPGTAEYPCGLVIEQTLSDISALDVVKVVRKSAVHAGLPVFVVMDQEDITAASQLLTAGAAACFTRAEILADADGWAKTLLPHLGPKQRAA